jgi:hypothetical protein
MAALSTLASKVSFFVWSCFPSGEIPKPPNCWKIVSRLHAPFGTLSSVEASADPNDRSQQLPTASR